MGNAQASITIVGGSRRDDYVIPVGMTIAGLLALIEVDLAKLSARLTLGGGRPVELGAVIGRDIPSGSVVTIVGSQESAQALAHDRQATSNRRFRPAMATLSFIFVSSLLTLLGVVAPTLALYTTGNELLPPWITGTWIRVALGSVCALIWMLPLADRAHCVRNQHRSGDLAAARIRFAAARHRFLVVSAPLGTRPVRPIDGECPRHRSGFRDDRRGPDTGLPEYVEHDQGCAPYFCRVDHLRFVVAPPGTTDPGSSDP